MISLPVHIEGAPAVVGRGDERVILRRVDLQNAGPSGRRNPVDVSRPVPGDAEPKEKLISGSFAGEHR